VKKKAGMPRKKAAPVRRGGAAEPAAQLQREYASSSEDEPPVHRPAKKPRANGGDDAEAAAPAHAVPLGAAWGPSVAALITVDFAAPAAGRSLGASAAPLCVRRYRNGAGWSLAFLSGGDATPDTIALYAPSFSAADALLALLRTGRMSARLTARGGGGGGDGNATAYAAARGPAGHHRLRARCGAAPRPRQQPSRLPPPFAFGSRQLGQPPALAQPWRRRAGGRCGAAGAGLTGRL
jgi:hypothetical protein